MIKRHLITRTGSSYYNTSTHTNIDTAERDAIKETRRTNMPHQVLEIVSEFEPDTRVNRVGAAHD